MTTRRCAIIPEVFFTAVAKPDTKDLRDFFTLGFGEGLVERDGFFALAPAGAVVVGIPVTASDADAAAGFFDQRAAREWLVSGFFLRGHDEGV